MTRRLVVTYLAITAVTLTLLAIPLGFTLAHQEKTRLLSDTEADADTMAALVAYPIETHAPIPRADILAYAARTHGHVVVIDKDGTALLDTENLDGAPVNYLNANRPEIGGALEGNRSEGTRYSKDVGTTLLYAVVPTNANGHVNGAVRITFPTKTLDARVRKVWSEITLLCLGVLIVVGVVAYVLARSVTRRVRRLEEATGRVAAGDLTVRVDDSAGWPELRHLASAFNIMAMRLAALIDAQQHFVADASHQLRTPLTALRLRLENLDAHVAERDRGAIAAAAAEVARMSRLVDGLLLLAREHGEANAPTTVDVAAVARERADVWTDVVAERGVTLDVEAPVHVWAVAVSGAVEQLFDNLVDNALTVAPSGTRIVVRVTNTDAGVELHVVDEGPGLAPEARARAFDRFWRAPDAPAGGSGLGLAIVRQLAQAAGGSARLDEAPGGGIDAVVVLRAAREPAADILASS